MGGEMKRVHDRAAYVTNHPKSSTWRICHLTSNQSGPGSSYSAIKAWQAWVMNGLPKRLRFLTTCDDEAKCHGYRQTFKRRKWRSHKHHPSMAEWIINVVERKSRCPTPLLYSCPLVLASPMLVPPPPPVLGVVISDTHLSEREV